METHLKLRVWDNLIELYREEISYNCSKRNIFSPNGIQYALHCKQCFVLYKVTVFLSI